jgi:uncharacterized protein YqfA (UPF0365 family)
MLFKRLLAIIVLIVIAIVAVRMVVGFVSALLWIVVLVALVAGGLWAVTTLRGGRKEKAVERSSAPELPLTHDDRVAAEMERIQQQLRQQRGA